MHPLLLFVFACVVGAIPGLFTQNDLHEDSNALNKSYSKASKAFPLEIEPRFDLFRRAMCNIGSQSCGSTCCYPTAPCCGNTCCDLNVGLCSPDLNGVWCCMGWSQTTCPGSMPTPQSCPAGDRPCPNNPGWCCREGTPSPPPTPSYSRSTSASRQTTRETTRETMIITTSSIVTKMHTTVSTTTAPPVAIYSPTVSHTFWTPAAIGGVAGGIAGGFVLLFLFLFCCCRNRSSDTYLYGSRAIGPLSDADIVHILDNVESTEEWQAAYTAEAQRMSRAEHVDRLSWMKDFATRAVHIRVEQLRIGEAAAQDKQKTAMIGFIPIVKHWNLFRNTTKRFNQVAIDMVGLGDSSRSKQLLQQAKKAGSGNLALLAVVGGTGFVAEHAFKDWWVNSDLAAQLHQELAIYLAAELGQEAATTVLEELVHIKPVIGWGLSATRAWWNTDAKIQKILQWLKPVALDFHLRVFMVIALTQVFPDEFGANSSDEKHLSRSTVQAIKTA